MPFAPFAQPQTLRTLSELCFTPFWLDDPARPDPAASLTQTTTADLVIVGAGFTGLWTALLARELHPEWDVVLLERETTACAASGRNGGFVAASLTHGFENGLARWPNEMPLLVSLGHRNLDAMEADLKRWEIDCDWVRSGELHVATEPYQVEELRQSVEAGLRVGESVEWLEADQVRRLVNSPTYLGAYLDHNVAMVNPARMAWGLRAACLRAGVRLYEQTPVLSMREETTGVRLQTREGQVLAARVALATNAFPPLLKRLSFYVVPVYDYVLVTEPLSAAQWADIGWQGRQGVGDSGNQFHYYRRTADGRILWGGYDAIYYPNNGVGPQFEVNAESFGRLAEHFFQTFPQLHGVRFTHGWGGVIDTCSRFSAFWGTAHGGRTAYCMGYTGLGVGAARFGAQVMLDLLDRRETERTRLTMVRQKPIPFPPEPLRSLVIHLTRISLDQADRNEGRRNAWLKLLDALGLGFDS
ncbi:MAG: FAD-binding oxidoreductase [Anaerolineales bacterium]|nr:FAD-binding oxidoreductase [Anaerolineales bacterium]MCX7755014.1 FAD-binding oxidoreductase [Anaerolineales bacterium]MDW8278799.1 FAD-dependent oxidoreductase [Anaerolineales bacterium]